ncbi:LicD family protein [Methanobrevibacter sp.]|uniref:LicD family protein n=1 Tax=Methanobrevibacter sp. TaxID=66852 RepID=UPI002E781463|nr:LicD family protein [Methanobrevibacter sp.]MEE0024276.1 LicD family protein [Methanobrevibacter sp.]
MKEDIKKFMLKEFEKQIDEIMLNANESNFNQIINLINQYKRCWQLFRFDLQNKGNNFNRVNILENYNNLSINFPEWFRDNYGQGCQIQGDFHKSNLKFQCVNGGLLKIFLRGVDYRSLDGLRYPIYVNFTTFKLNDDLIISEDKLICHDEFYAFEISSKDKEVFDIYLEFESIFDYYPFLSDLFDNVLNIRDLKDEYYLFKKQLQFMRFLDQFDKFDNCSLEMYDFMKNDNHLSLRGNEKNLFTYNFFLNNYTNYLTFLEINNKFNQLNSKIKSLENKMEYYDRIIDSDNALFSSIFLDYKLTPNRLLYNVQTLCLELLSFVNKICQKYGLNWWLDFGTLLGAIRHENFIPWDDDIDIGIMRKDYHKFIEVMFDELEKNNLNNYIDVVYRWRKHDGKEVNGSLHFFIRDERVGKHIILAAVDFAPYDFMGDYDANTFGRSYNRSLTNFYQMLCRGNDTSKLYMGLDYSEIIDRYFNELNLSYDKDKYIVPGVEGAFAYAGTNLYELIVLKYSDIFPLKESKFREYTFPVPNDSDHHLKQIYGNGYMGVPKDVRTHNRLNLFRHVPNINEILEEYVVVLKEANKNFKY